MQSYAVWKLRRTLYLKRLLPFIAGSWLGWKLYGKLDEAAFRKVVLVLLLVSGVTLVAP